MTVNVDPAVTPGTGTPPAPGDSTPPADGEVTPAAGNGEGDGGEGSDKTFTQAEVDAIATREAAKAARGKLDPKELGFDSAKDLKAFLDAQKEKVEKDKTEEEKAFEDRVTKAEDAAKASVLDTANARLLRAEFMLAAVKADVAHGEDAFVLAHGLDEWDGVEIKDDGSVTGFDDAFFAALKEAKPFLFKQEDDGTGRGTDAGAGHRGGNKPDRAKELAAIPQYAKLGLDKRQ